MPGVIELLTDALDQYHDSEQYTRYYKPDNRRLHDWRTGQEEQGGAFGFATSAWTKDWKVRIRFNSADYPALDQALIQTSQIIDQGFLEEARGYLVSRRR